MLDRSHWVCLKLSWLSPGCGPCRYVVLGLFSVCFSPLSSSRKTKNAGSVCRSLFQSSASFKVKHPPYSKVGHAKQKYSHLWYFLGILKQVGIAFPPGCDAPLGSIACSSEGCRPPLTDMCVRSLVYRGLFASQLLDVKGHRFGIYQKVHKLTNKQIYVYVYIYIFTHTHTWTWNFEHIIAWRQLGLQCSWQEGECVCVCIYIKINNVYMNKHE